MVPDYKRIVCEQNVSTEEIQSVQFMLKHTFLHITRVETWIRKDNRGYGNHFTEAIYFDKCVINSILSKFGTYSSDLLKEGKWEDRCANLSDIRKHLIKFIELLQIRLNQDEAQMLLAQSKLVNRDYTMLSLQLDNIQRLLKTEDHVGIRHQTAVICLERSQAHLSELWLMYFQRIVTCTKGRLVFLYSAEQQAMQTFRTLNYSTHRDCKGFDVLDPSIFNCLESFYENGNPLFSVLNLDKLSIGRL